ncbi:MAG: protein translocase subunit SecD [Candidatus Saccharimonadia bacterium]
MSLRTKFILIILLAVIASLFAYPKVNTVMHKLGWKSANLKIREGLDLQGGIQLIFQADLSKTAVSARPSTMGSLVDVMQRRANPGGTSEATVEQANGDRVIVQLPGETNAADAINRIGKPAQLSFLEIINSGGTPREIDTGISGKDVDSANVDFDPSTGKPIVTLQLKSGNSTQKFGQITTQINQSGAELLTMLDQQIIFGPATVSSPITDGKAQLQGNFTVDQAQTIAQEINDGALPVPVLLVSQNTIGPTLGKDSLAHSVIAGIIGLSIVALFMLIYYRMAGLVAVVALGIYTVLTIALYKLSVFTPLTITLSLAGIAGFILSIGMAVDANILIFERTKEEVRAGKSLVAGVEAGFDRAWTSIRDSNLSTLITCVILYEFSSNTPLIRGFAVTLGLGVLISMFTAVLISRTLLRMVMGSRLGKNPKLFGFAKKEVSS